MAAILRMVPEKQFRIIELAPQLLDANGNVDIVKAMDAQGELNLAIAEVQFYIHSTKKVRVALYRIRGARAATVVERDNLEMDGDE